MSRRANTSKRADAVPGAVTEAARLVGAADELLGGVLPPGSWPEEAAVERFLGGDKLDRVLSLYARAMRLDSGEPAYPWNLASAMSRLGLNDLALGFMARAIHLAAAAGDGEWSGPDAHLALAEVAIGAREPDLALTALAHAQELDDQGAREAQIVNLLQDIREERSDPQPQASLAALLERLPA
jgi:hypothetical protein